MIRYFIILVLLCIIIDILWVVESRSRVPVLVAVVAAVVMTGKVECDGGDCNDHRTLPTLHTPTFICKT